MTSWTNMLNEATLREIFSDHKNSHLSLHRTCSKNTEQTNENVFTYTFFSFSDRYFDHYQMRNASFYIVPWHDVLLLLVPPWKITPPCFWIISIKNSPLLKWKATGGMGHYDWSVTVKAIPIEIFKTRSSYRDWD